MDVQIIVANPEEHAAQVREVFWECLVWLKGRIEEVHGVNLNVAARLDADMQHLAKFMPPHGRLLLATVGGQVAGTACLKQLSPTVAELKRMYVRPAYRRNGLGHALVARLLQEARDSGYQAVRLDSSDFMLEAHHLYRSMGFREIAPYEGSDVPQDVRKRCLFMELDLAAGPASGGAVQG